MGRGGTPAYSDHREPRKGAAEMESVLQLVAAVAEEDLASTCQSIYTQESVGGEFVSSGDRDRVVCWLLQLNHDLHFALDMFFRATSILDAFLSAVKVRPRYLLCVAAACFLIAVKLVERAEVVSALLGVLLEHYISQCRVQDLHRMELLVMQKLSFNLTSLTALDFLKTFHSVALSQASLQLPAGLSADQHLSHMTLCLAGLLCNHHLMTFKPSLLALAVLGCDLKLLGADWLSAVLALQSLAHTRGGELSVCYEAVVPHYLCMAARYPLAYCSAVEQAVVLEAAEDPSLSMAATSRLAVSTAETIT